MSPSEFWGMHPTELWWFVEGIQANSKTGNRSLTNAELDKLYKDTFG